MGTQEDKASILALHAAGSGIGSVSDRGASGNNKSSPWTRERTLIKIPGQEPKPPRRAPRFDPFNARRFADNLHGSSDRGSGKGVGGTGTFHSTSSTTQQPGHGNNSTAQRTLLENRPHQSSRHFRENDSNRTQIPPPTALESQDDDIDDFRDEDLGTLYPRTKSVQRSPSPDPIDGFASSRIRRAMVPHRHAESASAARFNRTAPDGANTKRLHNKLLTKRQTLVKPRPLESEITIVDDSEPEPEETKPKGTAPEESEVEEIEAFPSPRRKRPSPAPKEVVKDATNYAGKGSSKSIVTDTTISPGHVANLASIFESRATDQQRKGEPIISKGIPTFDLTKKMPSRGGSDHRNALPFAPKTVPGVKNRMKGKNSTSSDNLTSSSTTSQTVKKPQSVPATQQYFIKLPVDEWLMGYEEIPKRPLGHYELVCVKDDKNLVIQARDEGKAPAKLLDLSLPEAVRHVKYSALPAGMNPVIQLALSKDANITRGRVVPGSKGIDGCITLKFHCDKEVSETGYKTLVDILLKDLAVDDKGAVNEPGARALWESHVAAKDWYEQYGSVESGAVDEPEPKPSDATLRGTARSTSAIANTVLGPARSTRARTRRALAEEGPRQTPVDPDEIVLVYPPSGLGAVTITRGDMQRLEPGQYLNDNLIEFGLKLWHSDLRSQNPELADQVYIFNTFFYKKIHVRDKDHGYLSVRKWTTKVDLFSKKFIIVPINEYQHWYLAIICNPEYVLKEPPPSEQKVSSQVVTRKRKREAALTDGEEQVEAQDTDTLQYPPDTPPLPVRHGDEAEEGTVEDMLLDQDMISASTVPEHRTTPSTSGMSVDVTDAELNEPLTPPPDNLELQYPSDPMPMDVDVEQEDVSRALSSKPSGADFSSLTTETEANTTTTVSSPTAPEVAEAPMSVDDDKGSPLPESTSVSEGPVKSVPVSVFYGTSTKGKGKEKEKTKSSSPKACTDVNVNEDSAEPADLEEGEVVEPTAYHEKTLIFTFDSLGTRHPAVIGVLQDYLQREAQDKKGVDIKKTSDVLGKPALVPGQPNYCDCGLYLIHFAQRFLEEPDRFAQIILTKGPKEYDAKERERDWDGDMIGQARERLLSRIMDLSKTWKEGRVAKEKEKEKQREKQKSSEEPTAPSTAVASTVEDSDDDVILTEVVSRSSAKKAARTKAKPSAQPHETKASRLRG